MTDDVTPSERLASVALELGLQLPRDGEPIEMLDRILKHLQQHRPLLLKGLYAVSERLNLLTPDGPVSVEELAQIRTLLGLWDVLPAYLPPLQPQNWSNRFLNTQYQFAMGAHHRLHLYFRKAHERLDARLAYGEMQHPQEFYLGLDPQRVVEAALAEAIKQVRIWLENGQLFWQPDLHADLLELELHYFRSNNAMLQEVKGAMFDFDLYELHLILEQLLPQIGPNMPRAAAEALNLLNLLVLAPVVREFGIGGRVAIAPETVGLLVDSLTLESLIWNGLGHESRALAANCCQIWLQSLHANFPADQMLKGTTPELAAGMTVADLEAKALEGPLFGLMMLEGIARMDFAAHPVWNAMNISPEVVFEALNVILSPLAANPSALPYRIRYRPVVRAILVAAAPILERTTFLCRNKREQEALAVWHTEWMRTRCRLGRLPQQLPGTHSSFEEWRTKTSELATEVSRALEEDQVTEEMSLEESVRRLSARMPGSTYAAAQTPAEIMFDGLKQDFPLYFGIANPMASSASLERSRQFVESVCSGLRGLGVDLLVATFAAQGINIMHYRSDRAEWKGANGLPEIGRTAMGMLSVYAGRPVSESEHDDAGWGSPDLPAGMTPEKLMSGIADVVVRFAFERHQIRARNCLIIAPDLEGVPLTCAFASRLYKEFGDEAQTGELSHDGGVEAFARPTGGGKFAGFRDSTLEEEIIWESLGLQGSVRQEFSPEDLLSALENNHDIVHMVTHGKLDHQAPAFSLIAASSGPLFSFDFFSREMKTKMLFLNTCSSGSGGAFGSASGFSPLRTALDAGVEVAVGNLFPVDTVLAAQFAITFQKALVGEGLCCASAFCKAVAAADTSHEDIPSFMLVGRSLESLFAEDWSNALLKGHVWASPNCSDSELGINSLV